MTTTESTRKPTPPRRRWLRWTGYSVLAIVLLLAIALGWLLATSSGLRFVLARAASATNGALSVQNAHGRLAGPLDLVGVRYNDGKGTDIRLATAHLDLRLWPLLHKHLHVLDLQADGVEVDLPASSDKPEPESSGIDLRPPLDIQLDRVHVGKLAIRQAGQPLFASNRLDLAGSWTNAGLSLSKLELDAPDGQAQLDGSIAIGSDYHGDGKATFRWKVADTDYAGNLSARSDGRNAHLELQMSLPTPAKLMIDLQQGGNYPWTAKLDAPAFDPKPILGDSSLTRLGLALAGSGDHRGGTLDGHIDINGYKLLLKPLRARFNDDFSTLQLEQLELGSPQIKGMLSANGVVQLGAEPISGNLDIAWKDLELPADLAGQDLASHGELKASGSAEKFHAEGEVHIGPPGKLAKLQLDLDGTQQLINLHTLALVQDKGGMRAKGTLTLQPVLGWQVEATADQLDPGQVLASWNGALNFDIASDGTLPQQGPNATLDIRKLDGQLRKRRVSGSGKLHLSSDEVVDGQLDLASGSSTIRIDAKPGKQNDADIRLAIATLADWLPDAGGALNGQLDVRGKLPALSINGTLDGHKLSYQTQKVDQLHLIVGVPDISKPGGKLDLKTSGIVAGGMSFHTIDLLAEGSQASHRLTLDARGTELSAAMAMDGSMKNQKWNGTISTLNLEPQGMPPWRLQQPSQLSYADGAMNMSDLCLTAGEPLLCFAASQDKRGNLDASYRLRDLPLALLMTAAGSAELPMRADGTLQGEGKIHRNAAGALTGQATINSSNGSITYTDSPDDPLASYSNLSLDAKLSPARQDLSMQVDFVGGGRIEGQLGISGAQQALSGQLDIRINDLGFIELFTSELAAVKGHADGSFNFAGSLSEPLITGQTAIDDFAAEVPTAGLKLSKGHIALNTNDAKVFHVDGNLSSGEGSLAINGAIGMGTEDETTLTFKGDKFTAADIPSADVVISPDLVLKQSAKGIDVSGSVGLDSADVNLNKLPGAGSTKTSPDVVIVDEKQHEAQREKLPITATVTVNLGDKTHIAGYGLNGTVKGQLVVKEQPGRETTGQGQIAVDGTYRAYGQNLHIERGQLLFASTPIDNPGLSIRAVRKLNPNATIDDGQQVGLMITGTAQRPVLNVFSNPVMEQSDALSYLVTGKPLSQVKGGEGNMVNAAAQALGSATGDLLAKRIGSHLGVDDIGVSSDDALGGSSAFTVGKYLSPRLYLSYGVGLFEPGQVVTIRYIFSQRWNFEAQNATEFNRASFNYRLEK